VLEVNDAQYAVVCHPAAALSRRVLPGPRIRPAPGGPGGTPRASLQASFTPTPPLREFSHWAGSDEYGWTGRQHRHNVGNHETG